MLKNKPTTKPARRKAVRTPIYIRRRDYVIETDAPLTDAQVKEFDDAAKRFCAIINKALRDAERELRKGGR